MTRYEWSEDAATDEAYLGAKVFYRLTEGQEEHTMPSDFEELLPSWLDQVFR